MATCFAGSIQFCLSHSFSNPGREEAAQWLGFNHLDHKVTSAPAYLGQPAIQQTDMWEERHSDARSQLNAENDKNKPT